MNDGKNISRRSDTVFNNNEKKNNNNTKKNLRNKKSSSIESSNSTVGGGSGSRNNDTNDDVKTSAHSTTTTTCTCCTRTSISSSSSWCNRWLPKYLIEMFGDLLSEDGLIVMGKGLMKMSLLACLCRYYVDDVYHNNNNDEEDYDEDYEKNIKIKKNKNKKLPLVIVLGLRGDEERNTLLRILETWGMPSSLLPIMITNESGQSKDRKHIYERGGVICITSRILIVDMLCGSDVIDSSSIDGIIVMNAEHVTEDSTEAFILRIYYNQRYNKLNSSNNDTNKSNTANKRGRGRRAATEHNNNNNNNNNNTNEQRDFFIKAISDSPEQISTGFCNVDKIMRSLYVRRLYLYPRFHDTIRQELEQQQQRRQQKQVSSSSSSFTTTPPPPAPPNLIQLRQNLSTRQMDITKSIVIAIHSCIRELKSALPMLEWNIIDSSSDTINMNMKNEQQQQPTTTIKNTFITKTSKSNSPGRSSSSTSSFKNNNNNNIEHCITSNYERHIMKQLEHDWHRISPSTKQLLSDIRTLRMCFFNLIHYDCVTYYKFLTSLRTISASSKYPSMWLLTKAADVMYRTAKERVYTIINTGKAAGVGAVSGARANKATAGGNVSVNGVGTKKTKKSIKEDVDNKTDNNNDDEVDATGAGPPPPPQQQQQGVECCVGGVGVGHLKAILEENPKWKLLKRVLSEIQMKHHQQQKQQQQRPNIQQQKRKTGRGGGGRPTNALVMVKDEKTVDLIKDYLLNGKRTLTLRWLRYLEQYNDRSRCSISIAATTTTTTNNNNATGTTISGPAINTNTVSSSSSATNVLSEESRLLLEEESRIRRILFGQNKKRRCAGEDVTGGGGRCNNNKDKGGTSHNNNNNKNKLNQIPDYVKKRRRIAVEKGRGSLMNNGIDDIERDAVLDEAVEITEHEMNILGTSTNANTLKTVRNDHDTDTDTDDSDDDSDNAYEGRQRRVRRRRNVNMNDKDNVDDARASNTRAKGAPAKRSTRKRTRNDDDDDEVNDVVSTDGRDNDEDDEDKIFRISYDEDELRVVIKSFASVEGDEALLMLLEVQPQYIVLYDAEVSFVRSVEVFSALSGASFNAGEGSAQRSGATTNMTTSPTKEDIMPIQVYFLMFEASAELKMYGNALEREKNSFQKLIHHKMTMGPVILRNTGTQEMQYATSINGGAGIAGTYMGGTLPLAVDTRRGRGKQSSRSSRRNVVVDVREFRSALPSILHQRGMRLAPVTLTVGDFVLSAVHCIERKSISDLYGSFQSGRLYTQSEAMCKYYKCPCLLIEFDASKSFSLQNANELGSDIKVDSICSKMVLLTMHFPRLRILWSRSPHDTCGIFEDLKKHHEDADVEKAIEIGRNESEEAMLLGAGGGVGNGDDDNDDDDDEDEINEVARDMLLRMPGVNVHSARKIMQSCDNLSELCQMSRDELRNLVGPATGQKLFTFFRHQMGST